ncbi:MAG: FAD-dependent oxidoreductase [Lachnospiraceae bacterium]|nr:FAD-dependent oxidoreductase [Lachnospiraceae bacterium]
MIINKIAKKISISLGCKAESITDIKILKRSIDARKKPEIFYIYTASFNVSNEAAILKKVSGKKDISNNLSVYNEKDYVFPYAVNDDILNKIPEKTSDFTSDKTSKGFFDSSDRPVIVGSGPAGLFCGLFLARGGFKPIIFERGKSVDQRSEDVALFWKTGKLIPDSNVQFGEGGAGTFSDGKLNTLVKDSTGLNKAVLKVFAEHGAPEKILYDAKPHIGTDILTSVVKSIREDIIRLGGEVHFESKVSGFNVSDGKVTSVNVSCPDGVKCFNAKNVVLAIGHSARDTFKELFESGLKMEQKPFSVGFRVIHPQRLINKSQYGIEDSDVYGAADYKLTAKTKAGRGVFSFCMCPGGYVVNASSEEGKLAVNGMSYSGRDGKCANSAIIFTVDSKDYPSEHPLAGIDFQRDIEKKAFDLGNGCVPIQSYGEYKKNCDNSPEENSLDSAENDFIKDCYINFKPDIKGDYKEADLSGIFTRNMNESFIEGMEHFDKIIPGFGYKYAVLAGVESRTSSPVRIVRGDDLQSNILGIYPCGEGAGYAGGITSAAMDGIKVAEHVAKNILGL